MTEIVGVAGWPQRLELVLWKELPSYLRNRYSHREPILKTSGEFVCHWKVDDQIAEIVVYAGLLFDGSSIPWQARLLGLSRFSRNNWQIMGAITHDPAYQGDGHFPGTSHRENRLLHDRLAADLWRWAGGRRSQVRMKYIGLRLGGWRAYSKTTIHPDPVMEVRWL